MVTHMHDDPFNDYTWMEYITPITATDTQQPDSPLASSEHDEDANQNISGLPAQFLLNLSDIGTDNTEGSLPGPRRFVSSSN